MIELKNFEILRKVEGKDGFLVDFIKPKVLKEVEEQKSPVGWYASSVSCKKHGDEWDCEANLNKVVFKDNDFVEFYIPKACGKEYNCRIHVDFDMEEKEPEKRIGRVGIEIKSINLKELNEFIKHYLG